jgi:hypothetical protein
VNHKHLSRKAHIQKINVFVLSTKAVFITYIIAKILHNVYNEFWVHKAIYCGGGEGRLFTHHCANKSSLMAIPASF